VHGAARRIGVLIQEVKLLFQHKDRHDSFTTLLRFSVGLKKCPHDTAIS
jgi:hypothetical protein